jgi:asparaginyl-tRNA synthetase
MPVSAVKDLIDATEPKKSVRFNGWIRTKRDSKNFSFLEVNDGSCLASVQVIADKDLGNYEMVKQLTTGSAVCIEGDLVESQGKGQKWEILCRNLEIISIAPADYPLQKKRHTDEYLRTIAHLRPRTNKYGAIFRIRSKLAFAVHQFFNENNFFYIHTPILTGSDCEGAGELFRVTSLDLNHLPLKDGMLDESADFFGSAANLTVSGSTFSRDVGLVPRKSLHLRTDFPGRKFKYQPTCSRILDDRTGNGLL